MEREAGTGVSAGQDRLDAARRLVPLDLRHVDRANAEGFLKSGKEMAEVAEEICRFSGPGDSSRAARELLARVERIFSNLNGTVTNPVMQRIEKDMANPCGVAPRTSSCSRGARPIS